MNATMQDAEKTSDPAAPRAALGASNGDQPPTAGEIVFDHGLPGFASSRRFVLDRWGAQDGPFSLLRSLDDQTEFLVVNPDVFFPDYVAEIDDETAGWLGLQSADDACLLVIVSIPDKAEDATANLLGPLVINRVTGRALQAVLNERWSPRRRLFGERSAAAAAASNR